VFKRLLIVTLLTLLAVGASATGALADHDEDDGGAPAIVSTAEFRIAAGQCPDLPAGLSITGRGISRTITHESATGFNVFTVIKGLASDSKNGHYRFTYHNTVTGPGPGGVSLISDHFSLVGTGTASGLRSAFAAKIAFDATGGVTLFEPLFVVGNPLDFATGTAICDPL
jgi:hypothetical protein